MLDVIERDSERAPKCVSNQESHCMLWSLGLQVSSKAINS